MITVDFMYAYIKDLQSTWRPNRFGLF
jgi:hypothetical protein